jgi:phytoene synthase
MENNIFNNIFRRSSVTFYYTSLFFPKEVRQDVAKFYAFVRIPDNFADQNPQDRASFEKFVNNYHKALSGQKVNNKILNAFVELKRRKNISDTSVEAFLSAMDQDFAHIKYKTIEDTKKYMYGSAAVIGRIMSKILNVKPVAYPYAESLGYAYQYINFIRDIAEDITLNRNYFPETEFLKVGLKSLNYNYTKANPEKFKKFIDNQIEKFYDWLNFGEEGYKYLPCRSRIVIKSASDIFRYTAKVIRNDPFIVYERKVKPKKHRVILCFAKNWLRC